MRVMGLDSSMTHTGYVVLDFDPHSIIPAKSPHPTHPLFTHTAAGTINYDDTAETRLSRLIANAAEVQKLVDMYQPDLVTIEGALDKGENRSPTGTALYVLIAGPWHPCQDLSRDPNSFTPKTVITITPERHMSAAHQKRKLTGTEKVKKYRESIKDLKGRVSVHQADAYFLAYLGTRFWLTLTQVWPVSILSDKEKAIFLDCSTYRDPKSGRRLASKSMKDEEGISWWTRRDAPSPGQPSPPSVTSEKGQLTEVVQMTPEEIATVESQLSQRENVDVGGNGSLQGSNRSCGPDSSE